MENILIIIGKYIKQTIILIVYLLYELIFNIGTFALKIKGNYIEKAYGFIVGFFRKY